MSINSKVEGFIDALRNRILSGEFGKEGRLPSFRALATEYKTTQETMNKTMQALQAEGLLISMGARGVFVNNSQSRIPGLTGTFYSHLKEITKDPVDEYIEKPSVIKPTEEIAEILGLAPEATVVRRFKKQGTKQMMLRIEEVFYPRDILTKEILEEILSNPAYLPVRDLAKTFDLSTAHVNEKVLSRLPTSLEQEILKIVRTNPIIDIKRTVLTKDKKKAIYYSHLILNANHFILSYDFEISYAK